MKNILVTGGAGYIGSHTVVELIKSGYNPVVVDDLSNSKEEVINRIEIITGVRPTFYKVSLLNEVEFEKVFVKENIEGVIHFAGFKAVGESVREPLKYYDNNINSTLILLKLMKKYNVNNIVFSSSATVYGNPKVVPIKEDSEVGGVTNPYGRTKFMIEEILKDVSLVNPSLNITYLKLGIIFQTT